MPIRGPHASLRFRTSLRVLMLDTYRGAVCDCSSARTSASAATTSVCSCVDGKDDATRARRFELVIRLAGRAHTPHVGAPRRPDAIARDAYPRREPGPVALNARGHRTSQNLERSPHDGQLTKPTRGLEPRTPSLRVLSALHARPVVEPKLLRRATLCATRVPFRRAPDGGWPGGRLRA